MDSEGRYTDKYGRVLAVGTLVRVLNEEYDVRGEGTVQSLPSTEDDYYGFPYVMLTSGKKVHIAEKNLEVVYSDDPVGVLEKMVASAKAHNESLKAESEALKRAIEKVQAQEDDNGK